MHTHAHTHPRVRTTHTHIHTHAHTHSNTRTHTCINTHTHTLIFEAACKALHACYCVGMIWSKGLIPGCQDLTIQSLRHFQLACIASKGKLTQRFQQHMLLQPTQHRKVNSPNVSNSTCSCNPRKSMKQCTSILLFSCHRQRTSNIYYIYISRITHTNTHTNTHTHAHTHAHTQIPTHLPLVEPLRLPKQGSR